MYNFYDVKHCFPNSLNLTICIQKLFYIHKTYKWDQLAEYSTYCYQRRRLSKEHSKNHGAQINKQKSMARKKVKKTKQKTICGVIYLSTL